MGISGGFILARTTRTAQTNVPCKSFLSKNLWDRVCDSLELLCSKTRTELQLKQHLGDKLHLLGEGN